jgi:hypothetical protein
MIFSLRLSRALPEKTIYLDATERGGARIRLRQNKEVGQSEKRREPTMKKLLMSGILGLCSFFTLAAAPAPAEGQVVVKVGPTHHYHHRYRHVYYRHGHRYYRYSYR